MELEDLFFFVFFFVLLPEEEEVFEDFFPPEEEEEVFFFLLAGAGTATGVSSSAAGGAFVRGPPHSPPRLPRPSRTRICRVFAAFKKMENPAKSRGFSEHDRLRKN